jgi:hypothetical protein
MNRAEVHIGLCLLAFDFCMDLVKGLQQLQLIEIKVSQLTATLCNREGLSWMSVDGRIVAGHTGQLWH